jgi:hypothetical protein
VTVEYVRGDPLTTDADTLAFGYNALGRVEVEPLITALAATYPQVFASYRKQCHAGRIVAGTYWIWRESQPKLMFMVVRDSPVGASRLRYVQAVALALARDYRQEGIKSLAIAPLGQLHERAEIEKILETWLGKMQVTVYRE